MGGGGVSNTRLIESKILDTTGRERFWWKKKKKKEET
jgi:hypothetical protein